MRDTLLRLCAWLSGQGSEVTGAVGSLDWAKAAALLQENTHALFGPQPAGRHVYIRKMETHQYKKRSLYRPLSVARGEP